MDLIINIAVFLIAAVIFTFVGMFLRKKTAEAKLKGAENEAQRIIEMANKEAENKKKEEIFKAKEEIMNARKDLDAEIRERRGILEAKKLGIPVIGLIDTNCNPEDVDYAIPGNDDAIRAVKLIADCMANAVIEGRQGESMDVEVVEEQVAEEEPQSMEEVVETAEEN